MKRKHVFLITLALFGFGLVFQPYGFLILPFQKAFGIIGDSFEVANAVISRPEKWVLVLSKKEGETNKKVYGFLPSPIISSEAKIQPTLTSFLSFVNVNEPTAFIHFKTISKDTVKMLTNYLSTNKHDAKVLKGLNIRFSKFNGWDVLEGKKETLNNLSVTIIYFPELGFSISIDSNFPDDVLNLTIRKKG